MPGLTGEPMGFLGRFWQTWRDEGWTPATLARTVVVTLLVLTFLFFIAGILAGAPWPSAAWRAIKATGTWIAVAPFFFLLFAGIHEVVYRIRGY